MTEKYVATFSQRFTHTLFLKFMHNLSFSVPIATLYRCWMTKQTSINIFDASHRLGILWDAISANAPFVR
jgi:hypothetical protein